MSYKDCQAMKKVAKKVTFTQFILLCIALRSDFNLNKTLRLDEEEKALIEAFRHQDINAVLDWLNKDL